MFVSRGEAVFSDEAVVDEDGSAIDIFFII